MCSSSSLKCLSSSQKLASSAAATRLFDASLYADILPHLAHPPGKTTKNASSSLAPRTSPLSPDTLRRSELVVRSPAELLVVVPSITRNEVGWLRDFLDEFTKIKLKQTGKLKVATITCRNFHYNLQKFDTNFQLFFPTKFAHNSSTSRPKNDFCIKISIKKISGKRLP